jgi:N6-L-threonylcarbamoyladenine synthase
MNILSIETSCDETAVALVRNEKNSFEIIGDLVSSQIKVHAPFGGVVPNLAAREHLKNLPLMLNKIIKKQKLSSKDIDLIAVTQGPGLIPALLIGTNCAKALAYAWEKPLIGVHHIAGHIYANFIQSPIPACHCEERNDEAISGNTGSPRSLWSLAMTKNLFPILTLIVSGGHTQLILMKKHMEFKIVGETLDDAAGEAFDKVARILNLGYPGGPIVSKIADEHKKIIKVRPFPCRLSPPIPQGQTFLLPRPMLNSNNLDFSFSGLKTAVLYVVRDNPKILKNKKLKSELCAEFQQAVIDVLIAKTLKAAKKYNPKTIMLGGGVSANKELRRQLGKTIEENMPNAKYRVPNSRYSLDNAAMIAVAGYFQYTLAKDKKKFENNWKNLEADAGLELK